jgi:hypothetical protein
MIMIIKFVFNYQVSKLETRKEEIHFNDGISLGKFCRISGRFRHSF